MGNLEECISTYEVAKPYIKNFRNAIDIGCRDGDFTQPLNKDFQNVYCFDYRNRMKIKGPKIHYYQYALGDVEEDVKAFSGVIAENRDNLPPTIVKQKTLDSFNFEDVDFIKVDVEGHEFKVLKGGVETIKKYKPTIIIEENTSPEFYNKGKMFDATKFLQNLGYKVKTNRGHDYVLTYD